MRRLTDFVVWDIEKWVKNSVLQHLKSFANSLFVTNDNFSTESRMFLESLSTDESLDDPVTHFSIMSWYADKCWLYHWTLQLDKSGKWFEMILNFFNCFLLICNYLKCTAEVALTNHAHHFHRCFLLFTLNKLSIITLNLGKIVARNWYEVYSKLNGLIQSVCKWTVFKAGENISSHTKLDVICLEVLQTFKLAINSLTNRWI